MKKLLITTVVISMAIPVFSQGKEYATKGVWELGGSAGYSSLTMKYDVPGDDSEEKITTLSFAPEVGYFIQDNISLGLMLDYTREKTKSETEGFDDKDTTTELYFAPTYVFKQDKMYLYGGLLLGMYSMSKGWDEKVTNYEIRGGIKVKFGENGLLNFGFQYLMGSGKATKEDGATADFDRGELSMRVGFSLYL